jgi:hypothetical protein
MSLSFDILRPDDLVVLHFEAQNLRLDNKDPKNAKLVVEKAGKPALLAVYFQPQSIFEQAYFETATITSNPKNPPPPLGAPADPSQSQEPDPPGQVGARMAGASRLVFKVPVNAQIPFNIASLLNWLDFECVVSATAAGKPPQGALTAPSAFETAIEMPYRLIISPGSNINWAHATIPETFAGRTALWHTRLAAAKRASGKNGTDVQLTEASATHQLPIRAIWSPDFVDHGDLPLFGQNVPFLAPMTPRDRAELVILTSAVSGYYVATAGARAAWSPSPAKLHRKRRKHPAVGTR